jgi:Copper amine oxidase, enzyme domain
MTIIDMTFIKNKRAFNTLITESVHLMVPLLITGWTVLSTSNTTTPRRNYWTVVNEIAETESNAQFKIGSDPAADLLIVNPNKKTKMENTVGS